MENLNKMLDAYEDLQKAIAAQKLAQEKFDKYRKSAKTFMEAEQLYKEELIEALNEFPLLRDGKVYTITTHISSSCISSVTSAKYTYVRSAE